MGWLEAWYAKEAKGVSTQVVSEPFTAERVKEVLKKAQNFPDSPKIRFYLDKACEHYQSLENRIKNADAGIRPWGYPPVPSQEDRKRTKTYIPEPNPEDTVRALIFDRFVRGVSFGKMKDLAINYGYRPMKDWPEPRIVAELNHEAVDFPSNTAFFEHCMKLDTVISGESTIKRLRLIIANQSKKLVEAKDIRRRALSR